MVIDAHYHPMFFKDLCETEELCELRKQQQAYYKTGRADMARSIEISKIHGIDKCILLPHDYSVEYGDYIDNAKVKEVVDKANGAFWGFCLGRPRPPRCAGSGGTRLPRPGAVRPEAAPRQAALLSPG